jgi:cobalt-zinc-cadmium efflux system protein
MPHDHGHHHHHHIAPESGDRRVAAAVAVNLLLTVVQIVAGVISGSLALIADAIHNLSDAVSLIIALAARRISRRPADASMTFGYGRAEVVAAMINYTTLIVIAVYLAAEGINRLIDPTEVQGWIVVVVAAIALVIDAVTALLIFRMQKGSVNMRAAFLHNVMDALGSVAVIFGGTLILLYDWRLVDPIVTLLIAGYILWHTGREIGPVIRILMLGSPPDVDAADVLREMEAVQGVRDVHHLHLWQMGEHAVSLEAHVVVAPDTAFQPVKAGLKSLLSDRFGIEHSCLELEPEAECCAQIDKIGHGCTGL